jgi:hypothetical protein
MWIKCASVYKRMSFLPTRLAVETVILLCWRVAQSREKRFCFKGFQCYSYYSSFHILHLNFWCFISNSFFCSLLFVQSWNTSYLKFYFSLYYFGRDWMSKYKLLRLCEDRILKTRYLFCLWHIINILPSIKHVKSNLL